MMDEMDLVFKLAKEKAIEKSNEPGNTTTPWKDFTPDWLKYRLVQEIKEWDKKRDTKELLDIINMAIFVYLSEQRENGDNDIERHLETIFGELLRPLIECEILKVVDGLDTDFNFTALPNLFGRNLATEKQKSVCCACGHLLCYHIDEEDGWRCHSLGPDFYQCECFLRKGKYDDINGYDVNRRVNEQLKEIENAAIQTRT